MAYDLIARVAALAAINSIRGSSIDLFVNIGTHTFDTAVTAITTGGCSVTCVGAATYVADSVATAALAAANPNLCKKSQDGRYWRLIPSNGGITVDQAGALGDPTGTGLVNDHGAIQAALNYAAALGIRTGFHNAIMRCRTRCGPARFGTHRRPMASAWSFRR